MSLNRHFCTSISLFIRTEFFRNLDEHNINNLYFCTGKHVTDISSASATGIFDPFIKCWSTSMINLLKLPHDIFPQVVETSGNFGSTPKDLFGSKFRYCVQRQTNRHRCSARCVCNREI
uniref:Carbohydrate kinase FGGY N-terminal domain-containing protein n=1 Tax=Apis cerana TaxID=7461 RepID=V9IB14_APICE